MKKVISLLVLFSLSNVIYAQSGAIIKNGDNTAWSLYTDSFLYQVSVTSSGSLNMVYFGNKVQDPGLLKNSWRDEITVRGGYSNTTTMVEVIYADGVRDIELKFIDAEINTIDGYSTLVITQEDQSYPLMVAGYIRVIPEYDLLEKWIEINNTGKKEIIRLENAQSGSFFLPKDNYSLTHLSGIWGHEFQPNTTLLTQGVKTLQIKDSRSFGSSFFAIRPEGETSETVGRVWYGSLIYSGNWRADFEKSPTGEVEVGLSLRKQQKRFAVCQ